METQKRPLLKNDDGQPFGGIRDRENILQTVEHLLGLCRGLLADNQLNRHEVAFLATWMENHLDDLRQHPVGRLLIARVARVVEDGVVTDEELLDLKSGLEEVLGGGVFDDAGAGGLACTAGADSGVAIDFAGRAFVVTGKFLYGPRRIVEAAIVDRGGLLLDTVSKKVHYVVIGTMGSRDWTNSSFGGKLEKVYELKEQGHDVKIVPEPDWVAAL